MSFLHPKTTLFLMNIISDTLTSFFLTPEDACVTALVFGGGKLMPHVCRSGDSLLSYWRQGLWAAAVLFQAGWPAGFWSPVSLPSPHESAHNHTWLFDVGSKDLTQVTREC